MKIDKFDIVHSLYNATNVGWDAANNKWLASDKDGKAINVVSKDVDAEYAKQEYKNKRSNEYPTIQDQLDMQYWDKKNGTTTWVDAIAKVKSDNPKP
jgi:hypothetical protein